MKLLTEQFREARDRMRRVALDHDLGWVPTGPNREAMSGQMFSAQRSQICGIVSRTARFENFVHKFPSE